MIYTKPYEMSARLLIVLSKVYIRVLRDLWLSSGRCLVAGAASSWRRHESFSQGWFQPQELEKLSRSEIIARRVVNKHLLW